MNATATSASNDMTILSDEFVQSAFVEMDRAMKESGYGHVQTARHIFYRHGLIATNEEVFALIHRVRRLIVARAQ